MFLYDLSKKNENSDSDNNINIDFVKDLIIKYAFKGSNIIRNIAIEGICKLIYNNKINDCSNIICKLIVLWYDSKII